MRAHSRYRPRRPKPDPVRDTYEQERTVNGIRRSVQATAWIHDMTRVQVCEHLGLDLDWAVDREPQNQ